MQYKQINGIDTIRKALDIIIAENDSIEYDILDYNISDIKDIQLLQSLIGLIASHTSCIESILFQIETIKNKI